MTDPHDMTPEDQAAYVRARLEEWLQERLGRPLDQVQRDLEDSGTMDRVTAAIRAQADQLAAARGRAIAVEAAEPTDANREAQVLRYSLTLPWELALELGACPRCWSLPCECPPIVLTLELRADTDTDSGD